jgi:DNA repair exonuclease SbcCD ATPase subunit
MNADQEVKEVAARVAETQNRLGTLSKLDPQREVLKAELAELLARMATLKDQIRQANTVRNFAGIGSPLHLACTEQLSADVVAALEQRAVQLQEERNAAAAARHAAKQAKSAGQAPAGPPPRVRQDPPTPEIIVRRPNANGARL